MSKVRADKFVNSAGTGAPQLQYGVEVPVGVAITGSGNIDISGSIYSAGISTFNAVNVVGVVTAIGFVGDLTGTATTALTATTAGYATTAGISTVSQGLTGTPNITVGTVTANAISASGTVGSASSVLTSSGSGIYWGSIVGELTLIQSITASSSSTIDFTSGITTAYNTYLFVGSGIVPSVDVSPISYRVSSNGGSSYDSGATDYEYTATWSAGASVPVVDSSGSGSTFNGTSQLHVTHGSNGAYKPSNNTSYGGLSFTLLMTNAADASTYTLFRGQSGMVSGLNGSGLPQDCPAVGNFSGFRQTTSAVNAIRFYPSSGNITTGTISLYGISY